MLVTVAVEDRAVRIEVGGGLEGGLTDVQSSRIIRGTIVPAFRAGRFGDGLYDAGVQILGALGALPSRRRADAPRPAAPTRLSSASARPRASSSSFFVAAVPARLRAAAAPAPVVGRRPVDRRRRLGRGGGGGSAAGGGWSGGGGGFSGGGASGRW